MSSNHSDNLSAESQLPNQDLLGVQTQLSELDGPLPLVRQDAMILEPIYQDQQIQKQGISQKSQTIKKRVYIPKQVQTMTFPQKLEQTKNNKRKYQVLVLYRDENDKLRRRIVKFGNYKQHDLLDGNDNSIDQSNEGTNKQIKLKALKNTEHVLQSNYWRKNLLNQNNDLYNNFISIIKQNIK